MVDWVPTVHFYCLTPKLNGHLQLSSSNETKNNLSYQIFYQVYLRKQCMCFEFKCAYCTADYVSFLRTVWTNCFSYLVKFLLCGWLWMKKWNSCAGFYQLALILFEGNNFRTNIDVDGGDDCPVILHHMLLSIHKNQAKISGWVIIDNRSAEVYQSALQILLNFNFN